MKKRITCILVILVVLIAFSAQVFAATGTYTRSWSIYNTPTADWPFSICVAKITMYAEGDTSTHKCYNVYELNWAKLGSSFQDTTTWIATYADGNQSAFCRSTYYYGIPKFDFLNYKEPVLLKKNF